MFCPPIRRRALARAQRSQNAWCAKDHGTLAPCSTLSICDLGGASPPVAAFANLGLTKLVFTKLVFTQHSELGPRAQRSQHAWCAKDHCSLAPCSTLSICDLGGASPPVAAFANLGITKLGFKQHSELGTRGDTAIFRGDELEGHELEGTLLFFGWCLRTARTLFTGSHLVSLYRQSVRRKGPLSWPCGAAANTFAFERAKR